MEQTLPTPGEQIFVNYMTLSRTTWNKGGNYLYLEIPEAPFFIPTCGNIYDTTSLTFPNMLQKIQ